MRNKTVRTGESTEFLLVLSSGTKVTQKVHGLCPGRGIQTKDSDSGGLGPSHLSLTPRVDPSLIRF